MSEIFMQFDTDGDKKLTIHEFARAFRAFDLPKRDGKKLEMDLAMFKSFDTNGDGFVDVSELEAGLKPKTRKKIEMKLEAGWTFDKEKWDASAARHAKWDMAKVFKNFDTDGDGKLEMREFMRAFRALGLEKRSGEKMEIDQAMFKSFDSNGDGFVTLEEFEANLFPETREKIVEKLDGGWTFDKEKWAASQERHKVGDV
jgi:Ca2+-binding EF-hand superfamily protein